MTDPTRPMPTDLTCDDIRELAAPFVLGALDANEDDAVRAHLAMCSDAHAEIAELAGVLPVLDGSAPQMEPPASLKVRLMAAAAADLASRTPVAAPTVASAAAPLVFPTASQREARAAARSRPSMGSWAVRIAAVLAIAVVGGWNLLLQGQLTEARTYEQNVAAVLDVAGRPGSLTAVLTAEGGDGPSGLAAVGGDGAVTLAMRALAPTSGAQVYEAWVIDSGGTPVPLGGFQVGQTGTAFFQGNGLPTEPGIVLALTLEPGPGATAPTSPVVSLGTATAAG